MTNGAVLTASNIRYLLALKKLNKDSGVMSSEIASALGVSRASVHNMMDVFLEMKYIVKKTQGPVFLTALGLEMASVYEEYYYRLKDKLFMGVCPDQTADMAIYAFLAELSEDSLAVLA